MLIIIIMKSHCYMLHAKPHLPQKNRVYKHINAGKRRKENFGAVCHVARADILEKHNNNGNNRRRHKEKPRKCWGVGPKERERERAALLLFQFWA